MSNISRWVFARNGNAVASLLFGLAGIVGLFSFAIILGPIAIGLGLLPRQQIAAQPRPGIGLAYAGIALGAISFIVPIVLYAT